MITLCLITKNEEKTLPTLLQSIVKYVDKVIVTDTGSTDDTQKICEYYCGNKLVWDTFDWCDDFSAARNHNFSLAGKDDWVLWADADDEIIGGENLKELVNNCERDSVNAVMFPYHYVVDDQGNTTCLQTRERLIKNDGTYRWIGKLHEAMLPMTKLARAISLTSVQWLHRTTADRIESSKMRNVAILEKSLEAEIKENKVDPRTLYNLGNAYFTIDEHRKALGCYLKYIPMSGWAEEIYLARHRSALALFHMGDYESAIEAALLALRDKPEYPDAYIDLGKIYFQQQKFELALFWLLEATKRKVPKNLPVINPMDYTANLSWLIGHTYTQLDKFTEARPHFENFQKFYPNNKDVEQILEEIDKATEELADIKAIARIGKLIHTDAFWSTVPKKYLEFPEVLVEKNKIVHKSDSTGKDMAIYCGKCLVQFDPSCETKGGIGGSEEAVINLARLLSKKGWNITVFGRPFIAGTYNGVKYAEFTEFNPRDKWDVFVSWRLPTIMQAEINATRKYLWLHDTTPESMLTPEVLNNTNKVIVLSQFHRSLYPNVPESKFLYSGNGINTDLFKTKVNKNKNYCIYTSAPDRGLEVLLTMWPKIRKSCPKAELHWFYGWETFDRFHEFNPEMQSFKQKILQLLDQPGVVAEGRVDHVTIAKKYQEAQLWLYPTEFSEIYCITADKAQAGGALPVTTDVAALAERVRYGTKFHTNKIYSDKKWQDKFIKETIRLLNNPSLVNALRKGMVENTLTNCSWQLIADQWDKEL